MRNLKQQRGMTFWGLLFVLGVVGFVLWIIFLLFPVYMNDLKVSSALDSLSKRSEIATMTKQEIFVAMDKTLDIDRGADYLKLDKDLRVETRGKMRVIKIEYEAVIPFIHNISLLLDFKHQREVRGAGGE
jgi:hypothetical protein